MSRDDASLIDMVRAARLAREFVQDVDEIWFLADARTQSAVLHQLMILGEAAKRISDEFRDSHTECPWSLIAGMRDKLIHHYHGVDLSVVWDTVQKDLPKLLEFLIPLVPPESK